MKFGMCSERCVSDKQHYLHHSLSVNLQLLIITTLSNGQLTPTMHLTAINGHSKLHVDASGFVYSQE